MRRKPISSMTEDECLTEQAMDEVKALLQEAKRRYRLAITAEQRVFDALDDLCINIGAPTKAENADNLGEAICCYLAYDEYSLSGIMGEVRALFTHQEEQHETED